MLIRLFNVDKMYKLSLPDTVSGNYWITDEHTKERLVNIVAENNQWIIRSNSITKILRISMDTNQLYSVSMSNISTNSLLYLQITTRPNDGIYYLFAEPSDIGQISHFAINNEKTFSIGSDSSCEINIPNNSLIAGKQLEFDFHNNSMFARNLDKRYPVFVNNEPLKESFRLLENGDTIFVFGIKIVCIGKNIFLNQNTQSINVSYNTFHIIDPPKDKLQLRPEDEDDSDLYSESEYFTRAPRLISVIEEEELRIDNPPSPQNPSQMPLILTMGSMLGMAVIMVINYTNNIQKNMENVEKGNGNPRQTKILVITLVIMLLTMVAIPFISKRYQRRMLENREIYRQKKYQKYINKKMKEIETIKDKQKKVLYRNYLAASDCEKIILNRAERLWERTPGDADFMSVRLGIGDVAASLKLTYTEDTFTMDEDNLKNILHSVTNVSRKIPNSPIGVSLYDNKVIGIISKNGDEQTREFMRNIILQLMTFQSYNDLKLVFYLDKDEYNSWDFVKMLPYLWNDEKNIRFFSDNAKDRKELDNYLMEIYTERALDSQSNSKTSYVKSPYYLVITNNYRMIETLPLINRITRNSGNIGFGLLCLTKDFMQLPKECELFINIEGDKGVVFEKEISAKTQLDFILDQTNLAKNFDVISRKLANIPIKMVESKTLMLPNTLGFLQMYNVGRMEQLNILDKWKYNDSVLSLKAPLGVDPNGDEIYLDIHEKADGPHGLVAGSTGSGKSEFLITYILSLAVNYSPDDIAFVLIDYKGGGLANAFEREGLRLPHLQGTITNIDVSELNRSLASIESELKRRERVFAKALDIIDEGTMDIYKYQRLYHEGVVKEPVQHLLIIADEFAELKQQQPDFMKQLVSVSRIGRSLGVHLILATQKPAGIVDDQIKSNTKFYVSLKVQTAGDSKDVIGIEDAAKIKQSGQFYMKVGPDQPFIGQSAWTGTTYTPKDVTSKVVDKTIRFISDTGKSIKEATDHSEKKETVKMGEELTNIEKYISKIAVEEGYKPKRLWLKAIPENIYLTDLEKKYKITTEYGIINPLIGELDDPSNQQQLPLRINLSKDGNYIIYGNASSGKETLLSTTIYSTIAKHSPEEVNIYIMDFGSEAMRIFSNAPQVGDIVFINDKEKITRTFKHLLKTIDDRARILAEYNGDYNYYLQKGGKPMPLIILAVNNYVALTENYKETYDDYFYRITRDGMKGRLCVIAVLAAERDMRYRMTQNFTNKMALKMNTQEEYYTALGKPPPFKAADLFGRGVIVRERMYEFQTAKPIEIEKYNELITNTIAELNKRYPEKAPKIKVLPPVVTIKDLMPISNDFTKIPIGLTNSEIEPLNYNFVQRYFTLFTGKNAEFVLESAESVAQIMRGIPGVGVVFLDGMNYLQDSNIIVRTYDELIKAILGYINDPNILHTFVFLSGTIKALPAKSEEFDKFVEMLKNFNGNEKINFIMADTQDQIKNYEYDAWFKEYVDKFYGIWIGKGVRDQMTLKNDISELKMNAIDNDMAFSISPKKITLFKAVGIGGKGNNG